MASNFISTMIRPKKDAPSEVEEHSLGPAKRLRTMTYDNAPYYAPIKRKRQAPDCLDDEETSMTGAYETTPDKPIRTITVDVPVYDEDSWLVIVDKALNVHHLDMSSGRLRKLAKKPPAGAATFLQRTLINAGVIREEDEDIKAPLTFATKDVPVAELDASLVFLLEILSQRGLKQVIKIWIQRCHPGKQTTFPYNGGKAQVLLKESNDPSYDPDNPGRLTAPDYWPSQENWRGLTGSPTNGVRHKEPDHILKPERIALAIHFLVNGFRFKDAKFDLDVMEDSTKGIELELGADLPPGAQKVLEALYKTARYKIQCNKGLLAKSEKVAILMPVHSYTSRPKSKVKKTKPHLKSESNPSQEANRKKTRTSTKRRREQKRLKRATGPEASFDDNDMTLIPDSPLESVLDDNFKVESQHPSLSPFNGLPHMSTLATIPPSTDKLPMPVAVDRASYHNTNPGPQQLRELKSRDLYPTNKGTPHFSDLRIEAAEQHVGKTLALQHMSENHEPKVYNQMHNPSAARNAAESLLQSKRLAYDDTSLNRCGLQLSYSSYPQPVHINQTFEPYNNYSSLFQSNAGLDSNDLFLSDNFNA